MSRRVANWLLPFLVTVLSVACRQPAELEGTYEELTPVPEGREYAYKLDLFRFGDEVGGVVRWYDLGDPRNSNDLPFFAETDCAFFGPVVLRDNAVAFTVDDGPNGESSTFFLSSVDPADINARVTREIAGEPSAVDFSMTRAAADADDTCSASAGLFELRVDLPGVSLAEAPALSLAIAFSGYEKSGSDIDIRRVDAQTITLTPLGNEWPSSQQLTFPASPPAPAGLSDPVDGLQYGVGYVVLFNDGNRDRRFIHGDEDDVVVALSPEQVVIYLAGSASGLNEGVAEVFAGGATPTSGYWLYAVERDVRGVNAHLTSALPLREGSRLRLERVGDDNPVTFPVLLP